MSRRIEWWLTVIRATCATITTCVVLYLIFLIGPVAETRWNPVLDKLQFLSIAAASEQESEIFVSFSKRRDCDYVGMAWFRDDGEAGLERVSLIQISRQATSRRPTGRSASSGRGRGGSRSRPLTSRQRAWSRSCTGAIRSG